MHPDVHDLRPGRGATLTRVGVDFALLAGLSATGAYNYLLFHSLAEVLSAVVAGGAFVVFWNSRRFLGDGLYAFVGIGYVFAGCIDLLHALAYKGMGVFPPDADLATQLWVSARYVQAVAVLGAVASLGRRPPAWAVLTGFGVLTGGLLTSIFRWDVFPTSYIEGYGLTPFKVVSEYIICAVVVAGLSLLVARRARLDRSVYLLFAASLAITVVSELAFTAYAGVYDWANFAGHVLKVVAFYLVYRAFIEAGMSRPLEVLFRDLSRHQEELQLWARTLEERVEHRTSALAQSEAALRQSDERFRRLFEAMPDGVVIVDEEGRIEFVNRQMETLFGYRMSELLGRPVEMLVPDASRGAHAGHRQAYREAPRTRPMGSGLDLMGRRANGSAVDVEIMLSPLETPEGLRVMAIVRDVTARKRLEGALRQSERLAAIGQMMTGLSHESRNALQRSLACIEMLGKRLRDNAPAEALLQEAWKAQRDLLRTYEAVRGYAAPMVLERTPMDVSTVWRTAWEKLSPNREGRDAVLREDANGTSRVCEVDAFRLEQVFRNLLENSLAACSDPVEIQIECSPAELHGQDALRVRLRDNGPGLDVEQRDRIFEPFFTTKTKGTGLGMPLVRRIVEGHGGRIEVDPGPGHGLEVGIVLPRTAPAGSARAVQ